MKYQEIIDRAVQMAEGIGGSPNPQPDRGLTAEAIFPHAVRAVYRDQAKTGRHLDNLIRSYPIELTNGIADLPAGIMPEYLDRSLIANVRLASKLPFDQLQRFRYDARMSAYAIHGNKIFYIGDVPFIRVQPANCTVSALGTTITGNASGAVVGDRVRLYDDTNGLLLDARLASINGVTNFTVNAKAVDATTAARTAIIYNGQDDEIDRSIEDLVTTHNSAQVSSDTATWTDADVGRRLRAVKTDGSAVVIDARIVSVEDPQNVTLGGLAISDETACNADVMYSPLVLRAVGIPDLPDEICDDLELSAEVAEDTIVKIAETLRGNIALEALVAVAQPAMQVRRRR